MLLRAAPVPALLGAALADLGGARGLAFWLLFLAVPVGGVCALAAFGELVEVHAGRAPEGLRALRTALSTLALALTVFAGLLHAATLGGGRVPRAGESALVAALLASLAVSALGLAREPAGGSAAAAEGERMLEAT